MAALAVPMIGALRFPDLLGENGALLWLLALVPGFLLSYHRGWRGVATALAAGMATLSVTQGIVNWRGIEVPGTLLGVVIAYVTISMGIGWVTERLHRERIQVANLALTDILTGLPNRRHATMFLQNEFAAAQRGRKLAVVFFDLDHFKDYNDQFGHAAGDEALQSFGDIMGRTTRRMNLSARFGGEEFLTVLAGSDAEGAVAFAERIRATLRRERLNPGSLTVSAGVAIFHPDMTSPDELLAAADEALYHAKRDGRDCVRLFEGSSLATAIVSVAAAETSDRAGAGAGASGADNVDGAPGSEGSEHAMSGTPSDGGVLLGAGRMLLLVENEESVRGMLSTYLKREGFTVTEASDVPSGVAALAVEQDVVVTDIRLPGASGNELIRVAKASWPMSQIIVITGYRDAQVAAEALNAGADGYLFKPFGLSALRAHLVDALHRRDQIQVAMGGRLASPGEEEALQGQEGASVASGPPGSGGATLSGAHALVHAVEGRGLHWRGHAGRVAAYASVLAIELEKSGCFLDLEALRLACELHDIGEIGIAESILNNPGSLSPDEVAEVEEHSRSGRRLLEPLVDNEIVLAVATWHHERWDGGGYPDGLAGEAIPIAARLVGLADALDAMTSDRPFREAREWNDAVARIRKDAGAQFDPGLMPAFEAALPQLHSLFSARERTEKKPAPA